MQAQYYWTAAALVAEGEPQLAIALRDRALALWQRQSIAVISREIPLPSTFDNLDEDASLRSSPSLLIVNALGSAIDLGHSPDLLGREIQRALLQLGCQAVVGDGMRTKRDSSTTSIELGVVDGKSLVLSCDNPSDSTKSLLMADVLRIADAARHMERMRVDERNRAALWPADPIETEAGALFVAKEMQELLAKVRSVAPIPVPVLLTGETGTGKEVLARLIHAYSNRAKHVFQPFNCSAVPRDMLDSQLFGHRRGSFTGAAENFQGIIRAAAGGTLFLDEIGETTLDVQPKLLRFLESHEVHPIGELHPTHVDVRVIAATNADLGALISQGRFREDLFYRLNTVLLHLPPLRERRVEIPALAHHYLQKHSQESGKVNLRLSEETMEFLVLYRWPGNIRQLANEMRRLATFAESGAVIMPEHLHADIAASRRTIPASERTLEPTEVVARLDQPHAALVQYVETAQIVRALRLTGWNMEQAAAMLGLSRKGLYLKRRRYGIEAPGNTPNEPG
jgi:DNA-binding NtrC family response regulator